MKRSSLLIFVALSGCSKCGAGPAELGAPTSPHAADASPSVSLDAQAASLTRKRALPPPFDPASLRAPSGCKVADPLMYVVAEGAEDAAEVALYKLDPRTVGLTKVGPVECWPFSIAADRAGTVWALGTNQKLYTFGADASCKKLPYAIDQHGFAHFYLAFVGDAHAKGGEVLYASDEHNENDENGQSGEEDLPMASRGLARVDRDKLAVTVEGGFTLKGEPSDDPCGIAGTADGRLFALCTGGELFEVQMRRDGGGVSKGIPLQKIEIEGEWPHSVHDRPFTFWGGALWLFPHPCDLSSPCDNKGSPVIRLDVTTWKSTRLDDLPVVVMAAGGSTCAPVDVP